MVFRYDNGKVSSITATCMLPINVMQDRPGDDLSPYMESFHRSIPGSNLIDH